jgi:hypothetical protein
MEGGENSSWHTITFVGEVPAPISKQWGLELANNNSPSCYAPYFLHLSTFTIEPGLFIQTE